MVFGRGVCYVPKQDIKIDEKIHHINEKQEIFN